jgi:hypothetical protein
MSAGAIGIALMQGGFRGKDKTASRVATQSAKRST